jgi:hypothetical protein
MGTVRLSARDWHAGRGDWGRAAGVLGILLLTGSCGSSGSGLDAAVTAAGDALGAGGPLDGGPGLGASATLLAACQGKIDRSSGGGPAPCTPGSAAVQLCGAPLSFAPTSQGFGLSAVLVKGDPSALTARVRPSGGEGWVDVGAPALPTSDTAQWRVAGLQPGTRYDYEVRSTQASGAPPIATGSVITQRPAGQAFTFALISDSHIGPEPTFTNQGDFCTLARVGAQVAAAAPDFVMNLGDMLDFHLFGFNQPPPDQSYTRAAYLNYRALLGDALSAAAHFPVIGNWDGEDGTYSSEVIDRSRSQRLLYLPGPTSTSYAEGGGPGADYYAFTWGDALFVALNVVSYTTTPHLLSLDPGVPDDWTLGPNQLAWLESTLATSTSKWKFLFIHHPVGGKAGDDVDSAYGRGGGQAAYVGEQATVHALMLQYGAQVFFYGHDHVFTDMVVDGIHYSEPGSAGAPWLFTADLTGYQQAWLDSGWGKVTVAPGSLDVRFFSTTGSPITGYTLE